MTDIPLGTHEGGSSQLQNPAAFLESAGKNFAIRTDDMIEKTNKLLTQIGENRYAAEIRAEFYRPDDGIHPVAYRMNSFVNDAALSLQKFIEILKTIESEADGFSIND